ncbi:hypothetical protein CFOL_v3_00817 [Cephalotus follicularis]|uniref:Uncharacterized protein n=1 Tax=Cephalotus follicularis TaxID=3775 RepID=A0A1Q3ANG0_CEPFO|nr:hypothetical protein CFOL_v3_00817 [Cephalotus follicularis]
MEPENIDWSSIESIFVEDDMYEDINAPKWVDLSVSLEPVNDEAWFCNPNCKHPKTLEDFLKQTRNSKVKLLRSVSISEILPFKYPNLKDVKLKGKENNASSVANTSKTQSLKTKANNSSKKYNDNRENKHLNFSTPPPFSGKPKWNKHETKLSTEKAKQRDETHANQSKDDRKPPRNLVAGREILNQITDFCAELKRLAKKRGSTEKGSSMVVGELRYRARERKRMPLIVVKDSEV